MHRWRPVRRVPAGEGAPFAGRACDRRMIHRPGSRAPLSGPPLPKPAFAGAVVSGGDSVTPISLDTRRPGVG
jgi:hypothetical protein